MKINIKLICLIIIAIFLVSCGKINNENQINANEGPDKAIIVNLDKSPIYDYQIKDVFFQHKGDSKIFYSDIVEASIDEIIANDYAKKLKIEISDSEIDLAMEEFKGLDNVLFERAIKLYGEKGLRDKLLERRIFVKVKEKVINEYDLLNEKVIEEFKNQDKVKDSLKKYSNEEILKSFPKEIKNYAFKQWIDEKKKDYKIEYTDFYEKVKNDYIFYSSLEGLRDHSKIDGKLIDLDDEMKIKEIKELFAIKGYEFSNIKKLMVKEDGGKEYKKAIGIEFTLKDSNQKNKNIDVYISDSKVEDLIDYGLMNEGKSIINGVQVFLSKQADINSQTSLLLRAIFKKNDEEIMIEASNLSSNEFLDYVSLIIER